MANRIKHWTAQRSKRRVAPYWEVRNIRDVVAVVYTGEPDAKLLAAAPKLLACLKHLVAIVRLRKDLRASERAKYEAAVKMLAEMAA